MIHITSGILPDFASRFRPFQDLKAQIPEVWQSAPESAQKDSSFDKISKFILQDETALNRYFEVIIMLSNLQEDTWYTKITGRVVGSRRARGIASLEAESRVLV